MVRGFNAELKRVLVFATSGIFFGFINGHMSWTLIAACALYICGLLWQIRRLDLWLAQPNKQPPDASGIWGTIFDKYLPPTKKQRKEKRQLKTSIKNCNQPCTRNHLGSTRWCYFS